MKRLLALIAITLLLTGCFPVREAASNGERLRITAVLPYQDQAYWLLLGQGALSAGEALGVDVKLTFPQLNNSLSQMRELVTQATAARVDAVIAPGAEDEAYTQALKRVGEQGGALVLVDTEGRLDEQVFIGTDDLAAGRLMGEEIKARSGGEAHIAVLSGTLGRESLQARLNGLREVLDATPGMELVCVEYAGTDALTVLGKYTYILNMYPQADTLLCIDDMAGYVLSTQLIRPSPVEHLYVCDVSAEGREAVRKGFFEGLFVQDPYSIGYVAVEQAVLRCQGTGEPALTLHTGMTFVSGDALEAADEN